MSEQKKYNASTQAESGVGNSKIETINGGQLNQAEVTAKNINSVNGYQAHSFYTSKEIRNQEINSGYSSNWNNPFYYDQQLCDKRLVVTLHPNAKYAGDYWVPFDASECFAYNTLKTQNKWNQHYRYRIKPIATAIATEDLIVNVSNSWTDFGRDNAIEGMFNSLKPYAPMVTALGAASDTIMNYDYSKSDSAVVKGIGSFLNKASSIAKSVGLDGGPEQLGEILNRQLTVQGTRFSYFSGSNVSFGNLSMKFTVFSDWIWDGSDYAFKTCYEQLEELYDYAMCKYKDVDGSLFGKAVGTAVGAVLDSSTGQSAENEASNFVERNFKWQLPPGGFRADLKSVDNVQKGTLKLRINDMYSLENLVITSMNVAYSRIPCKCPREIDAGKIVPLYADVTLALQPATLYSDIALRAFSEGNVYTGVQQREEMRAEDAQASATKMSIWNEIKTYEDSILGNIDGKKDK